MNYRGIYTLDNILFTIKKHKYFIVLLFFAFFIGLTIGENNSSVNYNPKVSSNSDKGNRGEMINVGPTSSGSIELLENITKNVSTSTKRIDSNQLNSCIQNNLNSCIFSSVLDKGKADNDVTLCDIILDPNQKIACKDEIIYSKALKIEDCNDLSINKKAECAYGISLKSAKKENNQKYCEKIDSYLINTYSGNTVPEMWSTKNCLNNYKK